MNNSTLRTLKFKLVIGNQKMLKCILSSKIANFNETNGEKIEKQ